MLLGLPVSLCWKECPAFSFLPWDMRLHGYLTEYCVLQWQGSPSRVGRNHQMGTSGQDDPTICLLVQKMKRAGPIVGTTDRCHRTAGVGHECVRLGTAPGHSAIGAVSPIEDPFLVS